MTIESKPSNADEKNSQIFPRAWGTYIVCLGAVLLTALEDADMPYQSLAVPFGGLILFFTVPVVLLLNLVLLRGYLRRHGWKGGLPLLACFAALPAGNFVGDKLIEWRFTFNRDQYEKVADQIYRRTYSSSLHDQDDIPLHEQDANLARSAEAIMENGKVAAVSFLVVSHPLGGSHVRFIRVYGHESFDGGVPMGAAHWYRDDY